MSHTPAKAQGTQWRVGRKSIRSDKEEGCEMLSPGHSTAVAHMNSTTLATFTKSAQDQAGYIFFFSMDGVGPNRPPFLTEKVLAVDGCRGQRVTFL